MLYFLIHVVQPPVLPNLQRIPPSRTLSQDEVELNGHNIYFYDDIATLRRDWQSQNTQNVAELLLDFYRLFSREFSFSRDAISLKTEGGLIPKPDSHAELYIEDPFQSGYNVSRTVTKDGLYTIRGEFMRAVKILQNKNTRVSAQLAELCEEREDVVARAPDTPPHRNKFNHHHHHHPQQQQQPHQLSYVNGDARPMRDHHEVQNRRGGQTASSAAGSFAFEEMARGLGRQRGQMPYPTTAMLAPLSQQGGLSPRPPNMGLQRSVRDSSTPAHHRATMREPINASVPSATRSDDGNTSSTFEDGEGPSRGQLSPGAMASRNAHASARTSPTFASSIPHGLERTKNNQVGEAWAFGSEIVFGSERFKLHSRPHRRPGSNQSDSSIPEAASASFTNTTRLDLAPPSPVSLSSASTSGPAPAALVRPLTARSTAGTTSDAPSGSVSHRAPSSLANELGMEECLAINDGSSAPQGGSSAVSTAPDAQYPDEDGGFEDADAPVDERVPAVIAADPNDHDPPLTRRDVQEEEKEEEHEQARSSIDGSHNSDDVDDVDEEEEEEEDSHRQEPSSHSYTAAWASRQLHEQQRVLQQQHLQASDGSSSLPLPPEIKASTATTRPRGELTASALNSNNSKHESKKKKKKEKAKEVKVKKPKTAASDERQESSGRSSLSADEEGKAAAAVQARQNEAQVAAAMPEATPTSHEEEPLGFQQNGGKDSDQESLTSSVLDELNRVSGLHSRESSFSEDRLGFGAAPPDTTTTETTTAGRSTTSSPDA